LKKYIIIGILALIACAVVYFVFYREKNIETEKLPRLYYLANCYFRLKQDSEAISYCQKAIKTLENMTNSRIKFKMSAETYNIWGLSLSNLNQNKQAIIKFKKSLHYAYKTEMSKFFIGYELQNIATSYIELDEYTKAKKYLFKSLEEFSSLYSPELKRKSYLESFIRDNIFFS
jgi:tetratricopeptide (TPR) repeat protein